jgi:hypothetical protein
MWFADRGTPGLPRVPRESPVMAIRRQTSDPIKLTFLIFAIMG